MSELVVVDPLPLKSVLALLCMFFVLPLPFGVAVWANRAISLFRGFVELALETPEIASNLNMDKLSQEEVLKYFYLRASGSFRELQRLLKNAAMANASDAQGIKAQIDEWYRTKIQPIKDVLADRGGPARCRLHVVLVQTFFELGAETALKARRAPGQKKVDMSLLVHYASSGP